LPNVSVTQRKAVAVVCVALVLCAAFVPATAAALAAAVLMPLWLVIPAVVATTVRPRASRCDDQPVALLALVLFRAPPHALPLA